MLLKLVQGTRARVQRGGGVTGFFGFCPQSCLGSAVGIQLVRELHQLESNLRPVYGGGIQLATIYVVGIQLPLHTSIWNPNSLPSASVGIQLAAILRRWNPTPSLPVIWNPNSLQCGAGIQPEFNNIYVLAVGSSTLL